MEYEKGGESLKLSGDADDIDRLIEEVEDAIKNTRSFLERLRSPEDNARELVDSMRQRFEKELEMLQRKVDSKCST